MPLIESALANGLERAFNDAHSANSSPADLQATAYHSYASLVIAGPLKPLTLPPNKFVLSTNLASNPATGWVTGLSAYWGPTIWANMPPPIPQLYLPISTIDPSSLLLLTPLSVELGALFVRNKVDSASTHTAAGRIAEIIHRYTVRLRVIAILPPPAPPTLFPLL